jgi:two-component system, NarL family, sensor kinase
MIGVKLTQIHLKDSQKNQEFIRLLVEQNHQIRNVESEEIGFDGQLRYFLNSVISFIENDLVTGGWGTQIDITELRETQQALLKAEQARVTQLARANTTLKKTLDVLATEPDLDRSLGHVLQVTTEQLESASSALWLSNPDSNRFSLHLVYLHGDVIAATPENVDRLSGQWIRERDLSRDLDLKAHIRDRVPVLYDLQHHPEVSASQRQFMESLGVKLLLGVPLLLGSEIVGSLTVRFTERRQFSTDDLELIQALAHQATLTIQLMHLADDAKQTALLEERNRMAGEIHDTLAQAFTGISIQVGMAQKLITTSPNDTQQILDRVLALAQTGLAEARRSVWALQPDADDYADLAHNLQICVDRLTNGLPMQVELETQGTSCLVPAIVGQNLLRIAQEAINNTICHAAATQLWIRLSCEENAIALSIQDNGRGFDSQGENGGFGLLGMSERASRLNGQFTLCSQLDHGTEIRVRVPIQ